MKIDVIIPDIGDFQDVPVIEIAVAVGDTVAADDPILMLESDKATLDIPAPQAGTVVEILVAEGDRVSAGTKVMVFETTTTGEAPIATAAAEDHAAAAPPQPQAPVPEGADIHAPYLVLGAGPGGYSSAFRAADLGLEVTLVDRWPTLGGVCLNVGCIPSKALLHVAKVIDEAKEMQAHGVSFAAPQIDLDQVRAHKDSVIAKLTGGLGGLARKRKVKVITGTARFTGPRLVEVSGPDGTRTISFDQVVIACGSEPVQPAFLPDDPRIIDSTGALELEDVPQRLLVIGGGIIGLEMAQVYEALGSKITIVELMDQIIPGADKDIVAPLMKRIEARYEKIHLKTKVTAVAAEETGLRVAFEGVDGPFEDNFDKVLVAVGRKPNGAMLGLENAGVTVDERGFVPVTDQMQTNVSGIFAIGDIVGQPMLAHKAVHEGKTAAEVAAGHKVAFQPLAIPSVAYTDPEIAWAGLSEAEAKAQGRKIKKAVFPWAASGRSLSLGRSEGLTKLLFDPETGRLLGAGIVGPGAGELLAEAVLAIEMGADAEDIGLTIHPHPTLSETVAMAAEVHLGTITDL